MRQAFPKTVSCPFHFLYDFHRRPLHFCLLYVLSQVLYSNAHIIYRLLQPSHQVLRKLKSDPSIFPFFSISIPIFQLSNPLKAHRTLLHVIIIPLGAFFSHNPLLSPPSEARSSYPQRYLITYYSCLDARNCLRITDRPPSSLNPVLFPPSTAAPSLHRSCCASPPSFSSLSCFLV